MKNSKRILHAVLWSGALTVVWFLAQSPNGGWRNSIEAQIADRSSAESNDSSVELESKESDRMTGTALEGMTTALLTLDASTDETGMDSALQPAATPARIHAPGAGGLRRAELMAEANRIMSDLLRDGLLSEPVGYACAIADRSPVAGRAGIIIERFRHMHKQHLSLIERSLAFGDQDSLVIRGWSQIRFDLAKMQEMAVELRNGTALATR